MTRVGKTDVLITGLAVLSAFGRGPGALAAGLDAGRPAFAPVTRFDVSGRRVGVAATLPGSPDLDDELWWLVDEACDEAKLGTADRAGSPLFLAVHGDPRLARASAADRPRHGGSAFAADLAEHTGLSRLHTPRAYTSACVAASTAIADAAGAIARGEADRIVVAGGYLVEPDQFALFDAGRALAADGQVRPFSAHRRGLLLGDGAGAVVLESTATAAERGVEPLARLAGWGRAGDAHHPCQPHPEGRGLARAVADALRRGGIGPADVGYVNAHGSGTAQSDAAETLALRTAFDEHAATVPVSSTKALHGQALEASGILELAVALHALRGGRLPVNAGYLEPDPACALDLVLDERRPAFPQYVLSLNAAFGGSNTALLLGAIS
ncbi:beta-ketoacyl-[acyl-carrier-protein] synthase family protein [Dactylosporangium matsuzakiense]|uniref:3-oxoacyl-[acyl-carrier-protein] synthase 2 n=1 Tax=Dactylosporangium matsuzakiense TaxID=53360 RepID=A0A9W6KIE0_9ACTN|nr:beta-ketoacyl synthase N-terminal-like domain-containing protein [Dactylosporangium matsuzakiense]UWZ47300.1 beta-ketoacyl-[acyl-carrier-protein] synthase family protein [Dactylosporangium matsuzakiense]GLL01350.1 3-oxoacyl-[acyl-carrier-protein] synthase 2 [Dactylosporangium matsuzakiense]